MLHWENPAAKTAIAEVVAHASGGFLLDKTIYHAADPRYHHAQPCDLGHVLAEGHKLKLSKVIWNEKRQLVHRTDGPLPAVGARAILHLDAPRRDLHARAHAAAHVLARAVLDLRGTMLSPPSVVGGGEARIHARFREEPRAAIEKVLAIARARIAAREPIETLFAPRDEAKTDDQGLALDAIAPGEPTLRLARCGGLLPCDAPLPERTSDVGELTLGLVQMRADGVRFGGKVTTS